MGRRAEQGALALAGLLAGGVVAVLLVLAYLRLAADAELAERVLRVIDLPASAFDLERMEGDSVAVVSAADVLIRSEEGDTIVSAPTARLRLRLSSLSGDGPIVADEVRLPRAYLNMVQEADGELNLSQTLVVTAGGEPVEAEGGRPIELRDIRIEDGRIRVLTPYTPDTAGVVPPDMRLVRHGGALMRERWARNVDGRIDRVRFGGGEGWQVQVAALSADLTDPTTRLVNLAGSARASEDGPIAFDLRQLRVGSSFLAGTGTVRFADDGLRVDAEAFARPLAFADARWLLPTLPDDGTASGRFTVSGGAGGRYAVAGSDLEMEARDSRITGFFAAEVGGDEPARFGATRLSLDPLRIETVRSFGIGAELPYTGEVRGVLSATGAEGADGHIDLDLAATIAPESGAVSPSTIFVQGPLAIGEGMEVRMDGVRASLQPLHLAALRPLMEEPPEQLRGVLRGTALLQGTPTDLRMVDGRLEYEVGSAPASVLTQLTASISTDPEVTFDVSARAEPIALGTVAELFPAMPFRTARFSGPIRIAGTSREFEVDTDLSGSAGRIAARGVITPGTPLSFDLSGEVAAFNAEAVLTRPIPFQGAVTGDFAANGTTEAFGFEVDLLQEGADPIGGGSFRLAGSVRGGGAGPPAVQVAGQVANFNLGAVIGRPRLFPSRMSGVIDVRGGDTAPYRFDVDLRGEGGVLDLAGYYSAGDVPLYAASGTVTGLDLRQLPGMQALPSTTLNGDLELEGQGTSLETLAGTLRFAAVQSSVGGRTLDRLTLDVEVEAGVLEIRTLDAALAGTELTAEGRLGLTRPATGTPLQLRAVSRDLGRLAPLAGGITGLPPRMSGSFLLQAQLTGSIREPVVNGVLRGQQLRYERYQADRIEAAADVAIGRGFERVEGEVELSGSGLVIPGFSVDSLRFAAGGNDDSMTVRLTMSREAGNDVQLAGVLELEGRTPRGVLLDSLQLRAGELAWSLSAPAAIRWGGVEGVRFDDLLLQNVADPTAYIRLDGALPPSGRADLRGEIRRLDLELVRRLVPEVPELAGIVDADLILIGPTTAPELFAQGYGTAIEYGGVALDSLAFTAQYGELRMVSRASIWQGGTRVADASAEFPMELTFADALPSYELLRGQPISASVVADSLPLALLTAGGEQVADGAGVLVGQLDLGGSVDDPQLSGFATIIDGAITAPQLGRRFDRIAGHVILDEQQVLVDSLVVWSGGRGEVSGSVRVTDLQRPELYLRGSFDGLHVIDNDQIADLTISGDIRLDGVMPQPILTGRVRLQEGAIYVPSLGAQAPLEIADVDVGQVGVDTTVAAAVGPTLLEQIRISGLDVVVEEGVWIESDEANVQIRGELVILRAGAPMQIYGTMEAVRGSYNLPIGPLLREFDVVSGSVRFLGTPDFNPDIDITAQHEVRAGSAGGSGNLAVLVRLTGTLQNPSIQLTSNTQPPLPESELLSYLVFGQPSFRLDQGTGALANQLVVQELVGGLLSRQLGELGLPCEYFRLRGRPNILRTGGADPLGSTSVECGMQLVEDVFLTVETGVLPSLTGGGTSLFGTLLGVSLDWQVNDRITATVAREPVQSALGTLYMRQTELPYQFSADVRGVWEFGRPSTSELPVPQIRSAPVESALPMEMEPGDTLPPAPIEGDTLPAEAPILPGAPVEDGEPVPEPDEGDREGGDPGAAATPRREEAGG